LFQGIGTITAVLILQIKQHAVKEVKLRIIRYPCIRPKLSRSKLYRLPLVTCLFLMLACGLPFAASAIENPADKASAMPFPGEERNITDAYLPAFVSPAADPAAKSLPPIVQAAQGDHPQFSSPADTGYNFQAYNSNALASKAVERNIGLFSKTIKDRFSLWLSRSGKYLEMMKEILRQNDVPENIVFLSLIESGFSPNAYSVAQAAGPWQFIASTARRYGLEINWWKDERRDPVKSTGAAASYLKDLYKMFGSWNLAMAAYNAGEGKILKAMKRSNADNYWALLETKHIKPETKEYVPRFIAASLIAKNPQDFGFEEIQYHEPLSFDEVELDSPLDLSVAAECAGTTVEEIKRLNPELRRWCTPPDVSSYSLKIPAGTKDQFSEALASIPENERFTIERYTVKKGETFSRIARKTGIPVPVILSLNSMEKIMPLTAGSTVYLPPKGLYTLDHQDRSLIKKASYHRAPSKKRTVRKVSAKKRSKNRKHRKI
jgi:membrane-bound lytic murein transglycosylase D